MKEKEIFLRDKKNSCIGKNCRNLECGKMFSVLNGTPLSRPKNQATHIATEGIISRNNAYTNLFSFTQNCKKRETVIKQQSLHALNFVIIDV